MIDGSVVAAKAGKAGAIHGAKAGAKAGADSHTAKIQQATGVSAATAAKVVLAAKTQAAQTKVGA